MSRCRSPRRGPRLGHVAISSLAVGAGGGAGARARGPGGGLRITNGPSPSLSFLFTKELNVELLETGKIGCRYLATPSLLTCSLSPASWPASQVALLM